MIIKTCIGTRCDSEYQDKKYGKNKRIHNEGTDNKLRCTVCGNQTEKNQFTKR